jgi:hypothetical protein
VPQNPFSDFIFNLNALSQGKPWGGGADAYYGAGATSPGTPTGGQGVPSGNLIPQIDPYGLSRTGFDPTGFNAPASPGQPASESPGWLQSLLSMAKTPPGAETPSVQPGRPTPKPPTATQPLAASNPQSRQGFQGNSREGIDMQKAMQIASIFAGMGGGMGAMGGGMGMGGGMMGGGGGGMGDIMGMMGGGGGGGGGGMGNIMGMMGGGGGGGGSQKQGPPPKVAFAPLPEQFGPLVPQNNPWAYLG